MSMVEYVHPGWMHSVGRERLDVLGERSGDLLVKQNNNICTCQSMFGVALLRRGFTALLLREIPQSTTFMSDRKSTPSYYPDVHNICKSILDIINAYVSRS
jgi:hypothetical protein